MNYFSQQIGWTKVLREERRNLKLDEKSKPKRFMLNRLIQASSEVFSKSNITQKASLILILECR
jgi:hypothetical protein